MIKPFEKPIYVTKPFLPPLDEFRNGLEEIWGTFGRLLLAVAVMGGVMAGVRLGRIGPLDELDHGSYGGCGLLRRVRVADPAGDRRHV